LYISLCGGAVKAQTADDLYADREHLASARKAAEIWAADLAKDANNFESAWKLARVCYWLGGHAPQEERRSFLERGMTAALQATVSRPDRPEGHFWRAANMGTLAESSGMSGGLKYRKPVKTELETVLRIDPSFMDGSADRVLGRWYFRVPRFLGGNKAQAEAHLRASLKYDPNSTVTHFFLADLLLDQGRNREARTELQLVIDAPLSEQWAPEDREYKQKATALLVKTSH
jgi:tetratricopeptide (TPR) repeat protein